MDNSLVSIIIPTRNCSYNLKRCLEKIKTQTYPNIEIIIVDGNSTDDTKEIAKQFTENVFNFEKQGDHRSAQRSLGVNKAQGVYVLIIDSDMELSENVILRCVEKMNNDSNIKGLIIPEESFGIGFWAQCKKLEKGFYIGIDWMEAARFFRKQDFLSVGGYNENMISGEDWDLSRRINNLGQIDRVNDLIYHNEGKISFFKTIKKKLYYSGKFINYADENRDSALLLKQTSIWQRYKLFFSRPAKLFKNPLIGVGMLLMKTCELGVGGMGYFFNRIKNT